MMKKSLLSILILVCVSFTFAGCGKKYLKTPTEVPTSRKAENPATELTDTRAPYVVDQQLSETDSEAE